MCGDQGFIAVPETVNLVKFIGKGCSIFFSSAYVTLLSTRGYKVLKYSSRIHMVYLAAQRLACEQALLFGRVKRVSRERASERRSREGQRKKELATIPYKFSFVLRPDEGKYHWLKNDVPEIKVD